MLFKHKGLYAVIVASLRSYATYLQLLSIALLLTTSCFAQEDPLLQARTAAAQKDYKKAIELYSKAYEQSPGNADIYPDYLATLLQNKNYKEAEQLIARQQKAQNSPLLLIDLGQVYAADGKTKKAEEQYELALQAINGDDYLSQQLANGFVKAVRDDYAIKVYERTRVLLQNPFLYGNQLARLYAKTGATDKSVEALVDAAPGQQGGVEETKATLLELLGNDPKKLQAAQKAFVKRINLQPENIFYTELLTWLYTQKGDWEGALIQMQAIDERNKENGQRLLDFARNAMKEQQYNIALQSLATIVEKGADKPLYAIAKMERLNIGLLQLKDNPAFKPEDVSKLAAEYQSFFTEFPQYVPTETMQDYAMLEAQYNNNPRKAIQLLKDALAQPNTSREFSGKSKLQLGDYQVLDGNVWEASLTYSQVDKAFREDVLGEEARFRNAKLAYYRGDFEWAQGQLSVLKASTSELIANDALSLSVLITENTPDSNYAPLLSFSRADLLLFQNKDAQAAALLDSMSTAYPKHTLNDDILMLRSEIAVKHRDYTKALAYLKQVMDQYGKDVLGDDAVFKTAMIYERYLHNPTEAKKFYEQLIIDYPGSTYVQTARERLQATAIHG